MPRFLILAQSNVTASALGVWLELLGQKHFERDDTRQLVWDKDQYDVEAFETVIAGIEPLFEAGDFSARSSRLIVLVDSIRLNQLNPLSSGWDALIARLILALPEVRWIFGSLSEAPDDAKVAALHHWHGLRSLFRTDFDPLMDGTGLRKWVCQLAKHPSGGPQSLAPHIPIRGEWAVALDDEVSYAYLHAYTAYRFGYRCFAVTTDRLAKELLGRDAHPPGQLGLTLEDYYLGWPDKQSNVHYANLEARSADEFFPALGGSTDTVGPRRYFITSGHERSQGRANVPVNRAYRAALRSQGRGGAQLLKPIAGIFNLWGDLGLFRELQDFSVGSGRTSRGLATGFVWPPEDTHREEEEAGHSAPGALLMIAEHLIRRAENLFPNANSIVEAVRGAVLASSAMELLGPKTPTTARDALELKHRYEVLAECQFGGVQFNLDLKARFAEVRQGLQLLARWYNRKSYDLSLLNGEVQIISRLMTIFQEQNEFDEGEECRNRVRHLQTRIWFRKTRKNPLAWPVAAFRWYIDMILVSLGRFATAIVLWLVSLSAAFALLIRAGAKPYHEEQLQAFGQVLASFFGADHFASPNGGWLFITSVATIMGFVHLGIFVSYLYSMISRR